MVYIDKPRKNWKDKCHLTADTLQELSWWGQFFGRRIHGRRKHPHIDLNEVQRREAILNGAIEVSSRKIVEVAKGLL